MSGDSSSSSLIFRMSLRQDADVVTCRNRSRSVAEAMGFDRQDQIRVATAVSEIARNAFRYAKDGRAELYLEKDADRAPGKSSHRLVCVISDEGPGIQDLESVLAGRYRSHTGLGMGLAGAQRLMHQMSVDSGPRGTTVRLARNLPAGKKVTPAALQAMTDVNPPNAPDEPLAGLASQNSELLVVLDEVNQKDLTLTKVSEELSETNRGVVALYDELETVSRVMHSLASKIELDDLLQALVNVTTEICGAESGLFHFRDSGSDSVRQHASGMLSPLLEGTQSLTLEALLGSSDASPDAVRIDDLSSSPPECFPLHHIIPARSYLAVPVNDTTGALAGVMVFTHRRPSMFTERIERILSSVALQASISIENAKLYKSVRSASAAKDRFLAVLSHELRTPLTPVLMSVQGLLEEPDLSAFVKESLYMIERNVKLEAQLIDDLLDMTRISSGKLEIERRALDLHDVVRKSLEICRADFLNKKHRLDVELLAAQSTVEGDAMRLEQAIWNLLKNAAKFTPPGGSIEVRSRNEPGQIVLEVTDNGMGIKLEALEKIFAPFAQAEPTVVREFGGLGLGLAISKETLKAHGGNLYAGSPGPGRGATFTIVLPLARGERPPPTT